MESKPNCQDVADFVISLRDRGPFLPYDDYLLLQRWVEQCRNTEDLLIILSDVLPDLYSQNDDSKRPTSLKRVAKRIEKSLNALNGESY